MALSAGTRLGPYEILGLLGAGGMGEVYRARDAKLSRDVALKVLPEAFGADPARLERFEREARTVAALSHPNILAIFDFGSAEDRLYAVMELLEGSTLRASLHHGPLSPRAACDYATQIASGLAAAHDKGIVHRDLKPENIFVTGDGRVKILDFGLARMADTGRTAEVSSPGELVTALTEPGVVLGTIGYMAPEQITGQRVDSRADIFALGIVMHEMLGGRHPFQRGSDAKTLSALLGEDAPELSSTNPAVSLGLERLVCRCLEKNPDHRFRSAQDVAFAIEALSTTSGAGRAAGVTTRRWPAAAILGSTFAVLAVAGVYYARLQPATAVTFAQLNYGSEAIFEARFSADGRTVLYSAAAEGSLPSIVVVRPEHPAGQTLGPPGTHLLAVSSGGELAVLINARYQCHRLFTGTLARMQLGAEAPREIADHVRQADWAPDGSTLAIIRSQRGSDSLEFPIGTVLYRGGRYLSDVRVSPDGRSVAFFEHPAPCDDRGSVAIVDRDGHARTLADGFTSEEGLAWSRDGREVRFSAAVNNGQRELRAVTLDGQQRVVLGVPADVTLGDISLGGRWLIIHDDAQFRIRGRAPGAEEQDLTWLYSLNPRLSGDGRRVAFSDEAPPFGPAYALVVRWMDGSPPVRLGSGVPMGFAPDDRSVLAIVYGATQELVIYPTGAGESRRLERGPLEAFQMAQWFPDGKRVLVCGNEPGAAVRCYVQAATGGVPVPITPPITRPRQSLLSPDGAVLLASDADGSLRLYPTSGGPAMTSPALALLDGAPVGWSADGRAVFARGPDHVPLAISRVDLATGRRQQVLALSPQDRAGVLKILSVTLARDGDAYAYSYSQVRSHLFVGDGLK